MQYELYHHGVKGMKWGRRKKKPPSQNRKIKNNPFNSLQKDIHIKEGNKLYRSTYRFAGNDIKSRGNIMNRTYMSTNKKDADRWASYWISNTIPAGVTYSSYINNKSLRIAGSNTLSKELNKYLNKPLNKFLANRDAKYISKTFVRRGNNNVDRSPTLSNMGKQAQYDTLSYQRYVKQIKKSGYDGMIDLNGLDVSEKPVILFQQKGKNRLDIMLKTESSKSVMAYTKEQLDAAEKLYKTDVGKRLKKYTSTNLRDYINDLEKRAS